MAGNTSGRALIEEKAESLAAPIAGEHGCRIYDVEYVREGPEDYYLNIYIDREGGVTISDCEDISRPLSDALDEANFISDPYTLIVSSPGLGRKLTRDRHLQNSLGEHVEGKLYRPFEGTKEKEFDGILTAWDADSVTVECRPAPLSRTQQKKIEKGEAEPPAPVVRKIPRKDIAVLRLFLDL